MNDRDAVTDRVLAMAAADESVSDDVFGVIAAALAGGEAWDDKCREMELPKSGEHDG